MNALKEMKKLCAITAAMCVGIGLDNFINKYGDRFFDVGIEEEHAVAFAGGLEFRNASGFAVFNLQRTYDQIFHDVALSRLRLFSQLIVPALSLETENSPGTL